MFEPGGPNIWPPGVNHAGPKSPTAERGGWTRSISLSGRVSCARLPLRHLAWCPQWSRPARNPRCPRILRWRLRRQSCACAFPWATVCPCRWKSRLVHYLRCCGSLRGPDAERVGHAAAIYYSLVESCKANKVNPLTYLTCLLSHARNRSAVLPTPDEFADLSAAPAGGCAL